MHEGKEVKGSGNGSQHRVKNPIGCPVLGAAGGYSVTLSAESLEQPQRLAGGVGKTAREFEGEQDDRADSAEHLMLNL